MNLIIKDEKHREPYDFYIDDNGKIKVTGSPKELKNSLGNDMIIFESNSDKIDILISEIKKNNYIFC